MMFLRTAILLFLLTGLLHQSYGQDTFYVKKSIPPQVTPVQQRIADSSHHDSIVSYTLQYQKANSNIWIVRHEKGPYIMVPSGSEAEGRILISDVIAVDSAGRKYRKPDQYYMGGVWADVPK
jgi:hypothetical protein